MKKAEKILDPARQRLLELVEAREDLDLKALSLRIGRNHSYLHTYVNNGSPRVLKYEDRQALAKILNVSIEDLTSDKALKNMGEDQNENLLHQHSKESEVASTNQKALEFVRDGHLRFLGPRDLPILGYVKAGELGFFIVNGERQGVTVRPEALRDVKDAYAVRVHDESMMRALKPGYLLFVDPIRPTKPGDLVVIQMRDGQTFIKELVRRTEKATICLQYNPEKEIKYDPAKVKSTHCVVQISTIDI